MVYIAVKLRLNYRLWLKALVLSCVILLSMSLYAWGSTTTSETISNEGSIRASHDAPALLYRANFDSLAGGHTYLTSSGTISGIGIDHYFYLLGTARVWAEAGESGISLRRGAGTKSLGLEVTLPAIPGEANSAGRAELNINIENAWAGRQRAYVRTWLYLPSDWELYAPLSNSWYEIANPSQSEASQGIPKLKTHLTERTGNTYLLHTQNNPVAGTNTHLPPTVTYALAELPRGRWFELSWFVDRITGTVKTWITDRGVTTLVGSGTGLDLGYNTYPLDWYTSVAKIYGNFQGAPGGMKYRIWCDGFEIYDDAPTA